jgi:hypothetical protein
LKGFFSGVEEGNTPRQVVKITMSAGKTMQAITHLGSFLEHQSNKLIKVYVPRHDLAIQYEAKLLDIPVVNARVVHIYSRTGGRVNPQSGATQFRPKCSRAVYVRSTEWGAGHSVCRSACQSYEGDVSEHFITC